MRKIVLKTAGRQYFKDARGIDGQHGCRSLVLAGDSCQLLSSLLCRQSAPLTQVSRHFGNLALRKREGGSAIAVGDAVAVINLEIVAELVDGWVEAVQLLKGGAEALLVSDVEQTQADVSCDHVVVEGAALLDGIGAFGTARMVHKDISTEQDLPQSRLARLTYCRE